jgi:hypothetical protein
MLLFNFLMMINPLWNKRYNNLSHSDKDKIITVFGVIETLIFWLIAITTIINKFW